MSSFALVMSEGGWRIPSLPPVILPQCAPGVQNVIESKVISVVVVHPGLIVL
jgi:hypothetical protein